MNVQHRTLNVQRRMDEFCHFKLTERSDFHHLSFVNRHSPFQVVSYERQGNVDNARHPFVSENIHADIHSGVEGVLVPGC